MHFGGLVLSFIINKLIEKHYTMTFSIIFGLFLAIIPNILNESCYLGYNMNSLISIILFVIAFCISYSLSKLEENKEMIEKIKTKLSKFRIRKSEKEKIEK